MEGADLNTTASLQAELEGLRARVIELERRRTGDHHADGVEEALLESSLDGIIILAGDASVTSVNSAFCTLSGYSRDEVVGHTASEFGQGATSILLEKRLVQARTDGSLRDTGRLSRKDGTEIDVEASIVFQPPGGGTYFVFLRDITHRLADEERVREHQSQLAHFSRLNTIGEMASGIAHEINQPLSAIMNYTSGALRRLRQEPHVDAELIGALENAAVQATRAGDIIRRMRNFVRRGDHTTCATSIHEIVRETLAFTQANCSQQGVEVEFRPLEGDDTVVADPIQIEQVLLNLVRNGLDAMEAESVEERKLTIELTRSDRFIIVNVLDTGPGIDPAAPIPIYDPFMTSKPDHVGLGLSISRSIIETHGGRLWNEPREESGARFSFSLPT